MIKIRIKVRSLARLMTGALIIAALFVTAAYAQSGNEPPDDVDVDDGDINYGDDGTCNCGGGGGGSDSDSGSDSGGNEGGNEGEDDYQVDGEPWCYPSGDPDDQSDVGGSGVGSGGAPTCTWQCGDDEITYFYNEETGEWSAWDLRTGDDGEIDFEFPGDDYSAIPSCGEENTGGGSTVWEICWDDLEITSSSITCGGDYEVKASARIPCPAIIRDPYPRALVDAPIKFTIGMNGSSLGSDTRKDCSPNIQNYTIEVGWQQVQIPPVWNFDDRPWSPHPNQAVGPVVSHIYETASFDKRPNGPSLEGKMELPSYQVTVWTYWMPRVREYWDQWHIKKFNCNAENANYDSCVADRDYCAAKSSTIDDDTCGKWRKHGSGWINIDMRWFGYQNAYVVRTDAQDATMPPPGVPAVPASSRMCTIPVPVIESQSLITNP